MTSSYEEIYFFGTQFEWNGSIIDFNFEAGGIITDGRGVFEE